MDIATHGLIGGVVAQSGFSQRLGRPATVALVSGAHLPLLNSYLIGLTPRCLWDRL
jgi:hypothetical protein